MLPLPCVDKQPESLLDNIDSMFMVCECAVSEARTKRELELELKDIFFVYVELAVITCSVKNDMQPV